LLYSYLHVDRKANIKYKAFITSTGIAIDVRYIILEKYLNRLWLEILERANNFIGEGKVAADAFSEPFLVISIYSLKLLIKKDICAAICNGFRIYLN
jgi:hypothetical protein